MDDPTTPAQPEDPAELTQLATTLATLQAQVTALGQARQAVPVVALSADQWNQLVLALRPTQQAFNPGVNPITSARNNAPTTYQDFPPPPGRVDLEEIRTPEGFSGAQSDARPFVLRLNVFFSFKANAYRLTRNRIHTTCLLITKPPADTWALAIMQATANHIESEYYYDDWNAFTKTFMDTFGIPNEKADSQYKIRHIEQGDQTLEEYIIEFQRLQYLAEYSNGAIVEYFKRGLQPGLLRACFQAFPAPETLPQWFERARIRDKQRKEMLTYAHAHRPGNPTYRPITTKFQSIPAPARTLTVFKDPNAPRPSAGPSRKRELLCHRCGKPGHFMRYCKTRLDSQRVQQLVEYAIETLSLEETARNQIEEAGVELGEEADISYEYRVEEEDVPKDFANGTV